MNSKRSTLGISVTVLALIIAMVLATLALADDFIPKDRDVFTTDLVLDITGSATDVALEFGSSLAEQLSYSTASSTFNLTSRIRLNVAGETLRIGNKTANDHYILFDGADNRTFGWDESFGMLLANDYLLPIIANSSNPPGTCGATYANQQWMDSDSGVLYVCDTTNSRNKWLSVNEYVIYGEGAGTCGNGLDAGDTRNCTLSFGDGLGGIASPFPTVTSITTSIFATDVTSHAVTMPATVALGDLLLVLFANDGAATVTNPSGWTELYTTGESGSRVRGGAYAKRADGTEDGTTVDFVTSAGEQAAAQVYRILSAEWYGSVVGGVAVGTAAQGATTNANPPSLNPSAWGTENTLWIAFSSLSSVTDPAVTAYPSSYTTGTLTVSSVGAAGAQAASARRTLNAASDDPGTFTNASSGFVVNTIGIRPSGRTGIYMPFPSTITGYGFSQTTDTCTSGTFDLEGWVSASGSDDNTYTLVGAFASGLDNQAHNSAALNADLNGSLYYIFGMDNNCGQTSGSWNSTIYYRYRHP